MSVWGYCTSQYYAWYDGFAITAWTFWYLKRPYEKSWTMEPADVGVRYYSSSKAWLFQRHLNDLLEFCELWSPKCRCRGCKKYSSVRDGLMMSKLEDQPSTYPCRVSLGWALTPSRSYRRFWSQKLSTWMWSSHLKVLNAPWDFLYRMCRIRHFVLLDLPNNFA